MSVDKRLLEYKSAELPETAEPGYRRPFDKATGEYWNQNELVDDWREKLWGPKRL